MNDATGESSPTCISSCWPVFSLGSTASQVRGRNPDTIFSYDLGLLCEKQVDVDTAWATSSILADVEKASMNDVRRTTNNVTAKEEGEGDAPDEGTSNCSACCRERVSSRPFCGVMWNPLLTSRLGLMGLLAVLLVIMTVLTWILTSINLQQSVSLVASKYRHQMLLHSRDKADAAFRNNNPSSVSLTTFLASLKQDSLSSADVMHAKVAPALFLVFSVLSRRACVTFFGSTGLLISYAANESGTYLTYANRSYLYPSLPQGAELPWMEGEVISDTRPWYQWYRQRIDDATGYPIGEALSVSPNPFWDDKVLKSSLQSLNGVADWGPSLVDSQQVLFGYLSPVRTGQPSDPQGAVSIGIPAPNINDLLGDFSVEGGAIFLTTIQGHLIAQAGRSLQVLKVNNTNELASQSGNSLISGAAQYLMPHFPYISTLEDQFFIVNKLEIEGIQYTIDSGPLHLAGATLVCTVVLPYSSIWGLTQRWSHITLAVLVALATTMGIVGCFFVMLLTKGVSNEMRLRAALIQQLEETKRAETKSNHKSLVFANMSHDLRTPLAAILGLIDLCLSDASEFSELGSNLLQMKSCATNLLGILNSILDMSKIEAGKILLQDSEFDLVSALEEVIDTFSVVGSKKGIEIALDLSDGFVEKASWVIGDVGRVKQIMANLLSNGVKFTAEGHVVLRGWIKPFGISCSRPLSSHRGKFLPWPWSQMLRSPSRDKELRKLIQGLSEKVPDDNSIQVEFEVDDTGRGIPKERWKSVFENFVQIDSSGPRNYDGTGLGLGIVRSLVRLMGGDIKIIDKDEPGEPGTRFRFNLIFGCKRKPVKQSYGDCDKQELRLQDGASLQEAFGVNANSVSPRCHSESKEAFGLMSNMEHNRLDSPPTMECVHILLAMQGQAGRKVVKKWMERRGLHVWTIASWEEIMPTLKRIKREVFCPSFNTSENFDHKIPECQIYDSWIDDFDGKNFARDELTYDTHLQGLVNYADAASASNLNLCRQPQGHLLLVIDVSVIVTTLNSSCSQLDDMLAESADLLPFRVVWLVNANTPSSDVQFLKRQSKTCNLILHKPLYASRLKCVWDLLQDLVGNRPHDSIQAEAPHLSSGNREKVDLSAPNSLYTSLSCMSTFRQDAGSLHSNLDTRTCGIHAHALAMRNLSDAPNLLPVSIPIGSEMGKQADQMDSTHPENSDQISSSRVDVVPHRSLDNTVNSRNRSQNALLGMHILVAEDNPILQRLAKTQLVRLGATVQCVDNGAEAARLVLEYLYKSRVSSSEDSDGKLSDESTNAKKIRPFSMVLMDCEMPILNGYEATQRIRNEENRYGIRTPIIALTAHAMAQDEKKCIEAGMDFYLTKPLAIGALLDAVSKIFGRSVEAP